MNALYYILLYFLQPQISCFPLILKGLKKYFVGKLLLVLGTVPFVPNLSWL
jgi:hypothetical protein